MERRFSTTTSDTARSEISKAEPVSSTHRAECPGARLDRVMGLQDGAAQAIRPHATRDVKHAPVAVAQRDVDRAIHPERLDLASSAQDECAEVDELAPP